MDEAMLARALRSSRYWANTRRAHGDSEFRISKRWFPGRVSLWRGPPGKEALRRNVALGHCKDTVERRLRTQPSFNRPIEPSMA